jgi:hypothetical protein
MSLGALYLALVVLAMIAFMGTLAGVTYGGDAQPRKQKSMARAHRRHRPADGN